MTTETIDIDHEQQSRRYQIRVRSLMMAVGLIALVLWLARESFVFWVALSLLGSLLLGVVVIGLGVGANWLGFRLFGLMDRFVASLRRAGGWSESEGTPKPSRAKDDPWDDFRPI